MDEKDSKPPAKGRQRPSSLKRGEGDIRARQRSFIRQRRAVLLPHEDELAQSGDEDASPQSAEHQEQIAQYRRRQRKRDDGPDAPAGEEEETGEPR